MFMYMPVLPFVRLEWFFNSFIPIILTKNARCVLFGRLAIFPEFKSIIMLYGPKDDTRLC